MFHAPQIADCTTSHAVVQSLSKDLAAYSGQSIVGKKFSAAEKVEDITRYLLKRINNIWSV